MALDRSGDIFTADKAMLAFLDYAKAEYLADQFVSLITVTTVDSVTVDASGETYTLGLTWPADAAEAGRCEAEAYYFQGNSVRKEDFTPLYSGIIGITFDKRSANDALEAEPVARVAFRLNAAPYETTVEYLPYDTHYYAIRSGAGTHFLVRREKVDAMTAMLREAAARLP